MSHYEATLYLTTGGRGVFRFQADNNEDAHNKVIERTGPGVELEMDDGLLVDTRLIKRYDLRRISIA